jgi:hypothetical protein
VGEAVVHDERRARQDAPLDLGRRALHQAVAAVDVLGLVEQDLVEVSRRDAEATAAGPEHHAERAAVVDAVVVVADARVVVARVAEAREELGEVDAEAPAREEDHERVEVDAEARELADVLGAGEVAAVAGGEAQVVVDLALAGLGRDCRVLSRTSRLPMPSHATGMTIAAGRMPPSSCLRFQNTLLSPPTSRAKPGWSRERGPSLMPAPSSVRGMPVPAVDRVPGAACTVAPRRPGADRRRPRRRGWPRPGA